MELKQHLIHRKFPKADAKIQLTIGEDYSVPDGKPDIASILQKKSELLVEEVHTEKGKIRMRGKLKAWVLYLAERSGEIANCLEMEFPFDEIMYMEGAAAGDHLKLDWGIDSLHVNIVHPGKLNVRALVNLWGSIMGSESHLITENVEEMPGIHVLPENYSVAEPVIERKDSYRFRDELLIPANKPNIQTLLWKDIQIRGLELQLQENKISVKGETLVFVMYAGEEDTGQIQWIELNVPFHGIIDVTGVTPEMFGMLDTEISHHALEVKPDYDGEMRMLQLEVVLDIHMLVYEERSGRLLKDAYSTKEQLELQKEEVLYEKLRVCNQTKCKVSGEGNAEQEEKILQVLGHQAQIHGKTNQMTEKGIVQEGILEVDVLYATDRDDRPFGTAAVKIPYSHLIEIPEIKKEDNWKLTEQVEQVFITMPEHGKIEIRAVLGFWCCVMQQCCLENVVGVTKSEYDQEEYKRRPGIVIHFVQPQESLWEIAKNNRCTIDEIKRMNDLTVDEVVPGQKLILLKQVNEKILS